jgi:hypothetical protein
MCKGNTDVYKTSPTLKSALNTDVANLLLREALKLPITAESLYRLWRENGHQNLANCKQQFFLVKLLATHKK